MANTFVETLIFSQDKTPEFIVYKDTLLTESGALSVPYYGTRNLYKCESGTLTITQGSNSIQQQGAGLISLQQLVSNQNITVLATDSNVTSYMLHDVLSEISNIQVTNVTSNCSLQPNTYAIVVDGSFVISSNTYAAVYYNSAKRMSKTLVSNGVVNANDNTVILGCNDDTQLIGNGTIVTFNATRRI